MVERNLAKVEAAGSSPVSRSNGAFALAKALKSLGVDTCFSNPGTSELHIVEGLKAAGLHSVLCLFEGVASGAADGYFRATGKPAATLFHLGPGFANAWANIHNAKRAHSGMICIVGTHAHGHRELDAPLNSRIGRLASSVSDVVFRARHADELPDVATKLVKAAASGKIATLLLPANVAWSPSQGIAPAISTNSSAQFDVQPVAQALAAAQSPMILLGSDALSVTSRAYAAAIGHHFGAKVLLETFPAVIDRGPECHEFPKLPYFPEDARKTLDSVDLLVLVGARHPVSFFAYPEQPFYHAPKDCQTIQLTTPNTRLSEAALRSLAGQNSGIPTAVPRKPLVAKESDALDHIGLAYAVREALPANAIVCDEACTMGQPLYDNMAGVPHTWMSLTGGSIGMGIPLATGVAIGAKDRPVLAVQGDGGAMYTVQSLWTMAQQKLPVVTLILNNGGYRILEVEQHRLNVEDPSREMTAFDGPAIDWKSLSKGLGVTAQSVSTVGELIAAITDAFKNPTNPRVIEVLTSSAST